MSMNVIGTGRRSLDINRGRGRHRLPLVGVQTPVATDHQPLAGTEQNERWTAWAGGVLFAMLFAEGVTIVMMWTGMGPDPLVTRVKPLHFVVGLALFVPLAQKLASTGYRFARYYTGDPAYKQAGPPTLLLRVIAPVLVLLTGEVLLTGLVAVMTSGTLRHQLEELHKIGFFAWFVFAAIHVLAYLRRVPRLVRADLSGHETGSRTRTYVTIACAVVGSVFGLALSSALGILGH
jgi:hypothetical protein